MSSGVRKTLKEQRNLRAQSSLAVMVAVSVNVQRLARS